MQDSETKQCAGPLRLYISYLQQRESSAFYTIKRQAIVGEKTSHRILNYVCKYVVITGRNPLQVNRHHYAPKDRKAISLLAKYSDHCQLSRVWHQMPRWRTALILKSRTLRQHDSFVNGVGQTTMSAADLLLVQWSQEGGPTIKATITSLLTVWNWEMKAAFTVGYPYIRTERSE